MALGSGWHIDIARCIFGVCVGGEINMRFLIELCWLCSTHALDVMHMSRINITY